MVLRTPIYTSYTRIKGRRKINRFSFLKYENWQGYPFIKKDAEFSYISNIGRVFVVYPISDSFIDSIQDGYNFIYPISTYSESPKLAPSMPAVLRKRIQELERLETGWDSYSASPISNKAIEASISILTQISYRLGSKLIEDVFIAPCADGSIQLEWEFNSKELILKIEPRGKRILYLRVNSSGDESEGTITSQEEIENLLKETLQP